MRSVRFVRIIRLDESGALSGNDSSDKHRVGNEEIRPFKLLLNQEGFLKRHKNLIFRSLSSRRRSAALTQVRFRRPPAQVHKAVRRAPIEFALWRRG